MSDEKYRPIRGLLAIETKICLERLAKAEKIGSRTSSIHWSKQICEPKKSWLMRLKKLVRRAG